MTLSTCFRPSIESCLPTGSRDPNSSRASARYRTSVTSVLLPLPDTPVTAVNVPSGNSTSRPLRLCWRAPLTTRRLPLPVRRSLGMGTMRSPRRKAPVMERGSSRRASSRPLAMISPPCSPAPGPMSMTQSAVRMVSSSCSTTSTVLPRSRSRVSVAISFALSRWCRPIEGSSRMYSTPISVVPIWVASRICCASPPESVCDVRLTVR